MSGRPRKTSKEKIEAIVAMATAKTAKGYWEYSYLDIAKRHGVSRSYVSIICLQAGIDPRQSGTLYRAAIIPPEFRDIYDDLAKKFHHVEAKRLVIDHIAVVRRRQAANASPG